jgi:Protein of unknown function (DUF3999)
MRPLLPRLCAALLASALCHFAQAQSAAISLQGPGPFYRLSVPVSLYPTAAHADLRELRVRNAAGQAVPFAWARADDAGSAPAAQITSHKPASFPLKPATSATPSATANDALLVLQQRPDGSLVLAKPTAAPQAVAGEGAEQWIIDTSQILEPMLQIRFSVAPGTEGLFAFSMDASDDLRQWREISGHEQLVLLARGGAKIERLSAELGGARARYLRLRWRNPAQAVWLTGVEIDSLASTEPVPRLEWVGPIQAQPCAAEYCDYLLPAKTPAHSLRIALAEPNTLANLRVTGLLPAAAPVGHERHLHRNPLYALRKKQQPPDAAPIPPNEFALAHTVVYRLAHPNGEALSPDVALDGGLYTALRLRTPGPVNLLGATPPRIEVASTARNLIFLARGNPPFQLSWGTDTKDPVALPLATLLPGYQADKPIAADVASVSITAPALPSAAAPVAKPAPPATPAPTQKAWLWAALGLGVLLLAGMAWSLFNAMQKTPAGK